MHKLLFFIDYIVSYCKQKIKTKLELTLISSDLRKAIDNQY